MKLYSRLIIGLVLPFAAACAGDKVTGPPVVASVELSPHADTMSALGQVRQFTAVAKDASGVPITGKTFAWSTSASSVASVDPQSGVATAVGNGQTTITAQVDGMSAQALLTVAQVVASVAVTPGTVSATALGATQQFSAVAKDGNGAVVANAPIVWLSSNHNVATIDAAGLATTTGPGTATITASIQAIPGTAALTVTQTATQVAITVQPTGATAGQALSPAVQVEIRDANGARVALSRDPVTLSLGANPGGGTLAGTRTVNAVDGVATFSGLALDKVGTGYTLAASAGAFTAATSAAFNITPAAAARLAVSVQPSSGMAGTVITPAVQVAVQDAFGNTVPNATNAVTVSLSNNAGGATLAGTATRNAVSGVATFSDLSLRSGGSDYTLTATAAGLASASSAAFNMVAAPSVASFAATQGTITSGTSGTLTAVFSGGTATIDHGLGAVTSGAAISTGTLTATTTFTLTVTNVLGSSLTDTVTVTVVPAPTIASLIAGQAIVTSGTSTSLTPTFSGGTGTIDHGVGPVASGASASTGSLTSGTTFTLTVTNVAGASVTATVPVAVVSAPSITSFGAAQGTITSGTSTNLAAVFAGGTATIDHGLGAVISGGSASTGSLTASTTFTLTVTNAAGASVTATVPVSVVAAPSITSFTSAQGTVTGGTGTILTAVFTGGAATIDHGVGAVTSGVTAATGALSASTTFTLTVTNAAGFSVTAPVAVAVVGSPTITGFLTAAGTNVITITSGTSTSLTAIFAGGSGFIDHSIGTVTSGLPASTGTLTTTTSYTLTVANAAGTTTTSLVTVIVVPAPSITSFDAASLIVTSGTNATLTPVFSGGTGTIDHGVGQVTSGVAVSPGATTTGATNFTLTVTNTAGANVTASVTITVVAPPTITSFTAAQGTLTTLSGTTLTPVFSGGIGTIDVFFGLVVVQSGLPLATGGLTSSRLFTLTVTNAAGTSVTATALVNVVAAPTISSFAMLGPPIVTSGTLVVMSWAFSGGTGAVDQGVGVLPNGDGGLALPFLAPGTHNFTLTVTNAAGAIVQAFASVTVVAPPSIMSFSAAPGIFTSGTNTMLTAVFSGYAALIDHGVGGVTTGVAVSSGPVFTGTTFTLTVMNAAGASVTATTSVAVVDPPNITGFSALQGNITSGTSTLLVPLFIGGTGTIDHGVGVVTSGGGFSTGNLTEVGTTSFTLTVTNAAGSSVTATVSVNVTAAPSVAGFVAGLSTVTFGTGTVLTPTFSGGLGTISSPGNGIFGIPVASGVPFPTGNLFGSNAFFLTVTNGLGASVTVALTVNVVAAPVITGFGASPLTLTSGDHTMLSPVFTGGVGTVDYGVGTVASGIQVATGAPVVGTAWFHLTVTNAADSSVRDSVMITTVPPPVISSFVAAPAIITAGDASTTLLPAFSGGTGVIDHAVGPVVSGVPAGTGGVVSATTTFTLTVTNSAGTSVSQQTTITVVPPPSITSFVSATDSITMGTNTSFTAIFNGSTGSIDNGIGAITSGVPRAGGSGLPAGLNTLTLTVTNAAGASVTATKAIEVVELPYIVSFTPGQSTIASGSSTTLLALFGSGSASVDHGVGTVFSGTPPASTGILTTTTTFTLTVTNPLGVTSTASVTVTVI